MQLRGIEFGRVLCSSGALGFFGDGYWYHKLLRPFGLNYDGVTFVAKTTTLHPRMGNMALGYDKVTPKKLLPACIKIKPFDGVVLNAVSLSGPGAYWLLESGKWQLRQKPFFISFMSVEPNPEDRLKELSQFITLLRGYTLGFRSPFGLEINFSCPNVGIDSQDLLAEVEESLHIAKNLGIPIIPNFGPDISPESVVEISKMPCDAVSIANTLKFGKLPDKVNWKKYWKGNSPLKNFGGGGLSGKPLFPIVQSILREVSGKCQKPIIAGGGILSLRDAKAIFESGASAIKLGTVGMLRPWRIRGIVCSV